MVRILSTNHALKKLAERGTNKGFAKEDCLDPDEVKGIKYGRAAARKHEHNCYHAVVVFEKREEEIIVVAVIRAPCRVLNKIGFTGRIDPVAQAIYIKFRQGNVARSEPVSDTVIIGLDDRGELIGIEILLPRDLPGDMKEKLARKLAASPK